MSDEIISYHCPECKTTVAVGQIYGLNILCSFCMLPIIIDREKGITALHRPITLDFRETYGRDKLAIDQMTSNREACKEAKHSHYFTGRPCIHGHVAPRTKRGDCHQCALNCQKDVRDRLGRKALTARELRSRDKRIEHYKKINKKWRENNPEKIKQYRKIEADKRKKKKEEH
jgi:hypothetical protein